MQSVNVNTYYYPKSAASTILSAGKKKFFGTLTNLFSSFRLFTLKRDCAYTSATLNGISKPTDMDRNEGNKSIRTPTSLCRRSAARNFNHNPSVKAEKHDLKIKLEENLSSELYYLNEGSSMRSISDKSSSTRKSCKRGIDSWHSSFFSIIDFFTTFLYYSEDNLSIVNSEFVLGKNRLHRTKNNLNKANRRNSSYGKENYINQYNQHKYFHRKKRKHTRRQRSIQMKTASHPSIADKIQPLSTVHENSELFTKERKLNIKSSSRS